MTAMTRADAPEKNFSKEINLDLFEFLFYVKNHLKFVVIPVAAAVLAAALYVYALATPVYEATSQLYVVNSKDSAINLSDLQIGSYLTSDYQWIFQTWEVNQQVINNLDLPYTMSEMKDMLTVENPSNTRILLITFASENAKEAAAVANEYAEVASQYISDYMLTSKPSIISIALEPLQPARPKKLLTVAVTALLAGFAALWCLFIAFQADDKVKSASDLRKHLGAEPLAIIPTTKMSGRTRKAR